MIRLCFSVINSKRQIGAYEADGPLKYLDSSPDLNYYLSERRFNGIR